MPTWIELEPTPWLIISTAMFVGAVVQSTIGFGMVVLALPVVLIVAPELVPGPISVGTMILVIPVAWADRGAALGPDLTRLIAGRFLGAGVGLVLLATVSGDALVVVAALVVLIAVVITAWSPSIERTPSTLLTAGTISGTFAMAVGIGGPPLALLYQHARGPEIRATISTVFVAGIPISLGGLLLGGHLDLRGATTGMSLWPAMLLGFVVARRIRSLVDDRIRPLVLVISAAGALVALGRVLLG